MSFFLCKSACGRQEQSGRRDLGLGLTYFEFGGGRWWCECQWIGFDVSWWIDAHMMAFGDPVRRGQWVITTEPLQERPGDVAVVVWSCGRDRAES